MKITLDCPQAYHAEEMRVYCRATKEPCAHQHYKSCKGWWVCSPGAAKCPLRKEPNDGQEPTPVAGHRNEI